jgi:hypothetical protein
MALTNDCHLVRYGVPKQLVAAPVTANAQLYSGAVALLRSGYLINAASPQSTDTIVGMVGDPAGGTYVKTGPGILGGSTNGSVWVNCETGAFAFQNGTGADALAESDAGATVYYQGENSSGPIAAKTNGGSTRPVLGTLLPIDPTFPLQQGQLAVKLTGVAGGL